MCFTQDGRYLVVGYEDGKVSLINSEKAEEIMTTKLSDFGSPITCLQWLESP